MSISDKYIIKDRLGDQVKRKFGDVFLVENKTSHELGVMKALRKSADNQMICDQLQRESTFNFEFKGLPRVLDFYDSEAELLLITKYHEGVTIDKYWNVLKKKERFPFLIAFLEALVPIFDHLGSLNVVHCDIKPSNILIAGSQSEPEINLIDFGLAINTNNIPDRKILFPLGYAAPELLLNTLDIIDQRTDIYALGILIWRLNAGQLPLVHPNPSIFTNLQLTHPLPEHDKVPAYIQKVTAKMSSKYQFKTPPNRMDTEEVKNRLKEGMEERYTSISQVINDLKDGYSKRKKWFFTT